MKKYISILFLFSLVTCSSKPETRTAIATNNTTYEQKLVKDISLLDELYNILESVSLIKGESIKADAHAYRQFKSGEDSLSKKGYRFIKSTNERFWVDVITYKYNSEAAATSVANKLQKDRFSRDIIFKEYSVLLQDGSSLILIKSGCSSPKNEWDDIVGEIKKVRKPLIVCRCGGACEIFSS